MNSKIRIESKYFLSGNNLRLFLISFFSIILRWCAFFGIPLLIYFVFFADKFATAFKTESEALTLFLKILFCTVTTVISLLFICGIKNCENTAFFISSKGKKPKLKQIIKNFYPMTLFKTLFLYVKIISLKIFWAFYYSFPALICLGMLLYMYNKSALSYSVFMVLSFGSSLLFSVCLFMYKATVFRYSAAPYYILFNKKAKINSAIKNSLRDTDEYIQSALLLKTSLMGWVISCLAIFPCFYVLPYYKICNTLFLYNCITKKNETPVKSTYAISYLKLEKNQDNI